MFDPRKVAIFLSSNRSSLRYDLNHKSIAHLNYMVVEYSFSTVYTMCMWYACNEMYETESTLDMVRMCNVYFVIELARVLTFDM